MSMNIVIVNSSLAQSQLPNENIACTICPLAHWMQSQSDIKCFCTKINKITWDRYKSDKITVCSSQIDAIAKENAKNGREMPTPLIKRELIEQMEDVVKNKRIDALI